MKEFLKLNNKLNLELKIKPLSPLCIKLSKEEKEGEDSKSSTYSTILVTEQGETKANSTGDLELDTRRGEIYIPGSTLKGLFRDRFITMYKDDTFVKNLFGYTDGDLDEENAKKSRIFLQDAFLFKNEKRKNFYDENKIKKAF